MLNKVRFLKSAPSLIEIICAVLPCHEINTENLIFSDFRSYLLIIFTIFLGLMNTFIQFCVRIYHQGFRKINWHCTRKHVSTHQVLSYADDVIIY